MLFEHKPWPGESVYLSQDKGLPRYVAHSFAYLAKCSPAPPEQTADCSLLAKRLEALGTLISDLQAQYNEVKASLRQQCHHPLTLRRYIVRVYKDEYDNYLNGPDDILCAGCDQVIAKVETT